MLEIKDKSKCCGCTACENKCPQNAIKMIEDETGFKYPVVEEKKCIKCGLCEKVCPIVNNKKIENSPVAYACINKNDEVRKESSSGGIFSLIADWILEQKGIVFGAAFDEKFELCHIYVERKEELYKLRTSKYFQSYINDSYKKAKAFLNMGKLVLFTGTPCQIEGLKTYLNKEYENLYTQDIICHGVPSPKVWRKYKEFRKRKDGKTPKSINFRNKDKGWNTFSLKFEYDNTEYSKTQNEDIFMKAFLNDLCLRASCYNCSFKKYNRLSDITLADFWGIQNIDRNMDDDKGTSLVIVNSDKGQQLFEKIKNNCIVKDVDLDKSIEYNPSFIKSVKYNRNRDKFFEKIDDMEFDELVNKYMVKPSFTRRMTEKAKRVVKKIIKK